MSGNGIQVPAGVGRLLSSDKSMTVGGFVIVRDGLAFTCSHVVNDALGRDRKSGRTPTHQDQMTGIIQSNGTEVELSLTVDKWSSPRSGDIVALNVGTDLNIDLPTPFLFNDDAIIGAHVTSYGFPNGYPQGLWGEGRVVKSFTNGRLQINHLGDGAVAIAPGFSGSGVWSDRGSLIGIVATADERRDVAGVVDIATLFAFLEPQGNAGARSTIPWMVRHFYMATLTAFLHDLYNASEDGIGDDVCAMVKETLDRTGTNLSGYDYVDENNGAEWTESPLDVLEAFREEYSRWNDAKTHDGRLTSHRVILRHRRNLTRRLRVALNPAIYKDEYGASDVIELFEPFSRLARSHPAIFANVRRKVNDKGLVAVRRGL
ncbi:trypsin-like peptidase domain-containing protein [Mycolicibacterium wolinskyi]|uniref:S1 family peptidase n=1 Tax=Mycolicibacterium TaxID=1866885 RepID=UPI000A150467|nr:MULTISPECIES: serine protease [Mycolicibacterium]MCV7286720.1 trypsin-like peptidase domain-containing protein [Mycolicibacterium wolinskyi]MCV7293700.1 trypsin-like peptidase domain-containing protein [Mycolicibacterium goodii]